MPDKLLIATTNFGKQAELRAIFAADGFELLTPGELKLTLTVIESGNSYEENARIKAQAFCTASGLPALADDTGLEVDALGGAPGLFSARFSPKPGATDADRRALLREKLKDAPHPWTARFTCSMALVLPDGREFIQHGTCQGEITADERGDDGFGYDRIFLCKDAGRTMAELSMAEKNRISHRAKAAAGFHDILRAIA